MKKLIIEVTYDHNHWHAACPLMKEELGLGIGNTIPEAIDELVSRMRLHAVGTHSAYMAKLLAKED